MTLNDRFDAQRDAINPPCDSRFVAFTVLSSVGLNQICPVRGQLIPLKPLGYQF